MKRFMRLDGAQRLGISSVLVSLAFASFAAPAPAADKLDPGFAKWWQKFQMAVMRRDVRSIEKGVEYPMDWEISSDVRAIRSESDLAANFAIFFTPDVMKNIAAGKPEKLKNGNYLLVWKSGNSEYSLNIRYYNGTYALDSLGQGPP